MPDEAENIEVYFPSEGVSISIPRELYRAECVCGAPIASYTRETKCEACGRVLVLDWGALHREQAGGKA